MNYLTVRRPRSGQTAMSTSMSDFDRLFDSVFGSMPSWSNSRPAVDVRETDDEYQVEADLPGFTDEQIDVHVENELLVISAEANSDNENADENAKYLLRERTARSFRRSFALPKDADANKIEARFQNGVLSLTLAKRAEAKPRKISIKRG